MGNAAFVQPVLQDELIIASPPEAWSPAPMTMVSLPAPPFRKSISKSSMSPFKPDSQSLPAPPSSVSTPRHRQACHHHSHQPASHHRRHRPASPALRRQEACRPQRRRQAVIAHHDRTSGRRQHHPPDQVVARLTLQAVVTCAADDGVVTVAAPDGIVTVARINPVITGAAVDQVGAAFAVIWSLPRPPESTSAVSVPATEGLRQSGRAVSSDSASAGRGRVVIKQVRRAGQRSCPIVVWGIGSSSSSLRVALVTAWHPPRHRPSGPRTTKYCKHSRNPFTRCGRGR